MKTIYMLLAAITLTLCATAQDPAIIKESWEDNRGLHTLAPQFANESAIVLRDKRRIEYMDEGKDGLVMYRTLHKIIRVNDDKGIEAFNTIYLGVSNNSDI